MPRQALKTRQPHPIGRVARAKRGKGRNAQAAPKNAPEDLPDEPDFSDLQDEPSDQEEAQEPEGGHTGGRRNAHDLYMRELGRAGDLLTPEEELQLAEQMLHFVIAHVLERIASAEKTARSRRASKRQREAALAFIRDFNPKRLKRPEKLRQRLTQLFYEDDEGREAYSYFIDRVPDARRCREEFVKRNLRLVVSIAGKNYAERLTLLDRIQEGNLGLMHAVARYDYRRGFRFSTYAAWWIRHAIGRAVSDKAREIRVPVHLIESYWRYSQTKRELVKTLGRIPTREEAAQRIGIPQEKLEKMLPVFLEPASLDAPAKNDEGFGDDLHELLFVPAKDPDAEEAAEDAERAQHVLHALRQPHLLSPIEREVIMRRFGLVPGKGRHQQTEETFVEISRTYHLSRERIRQIQNQALAKLKRFLARRVRIAA